MAQPQTQRRRRLRPGTSAVFNGVSGTSSDRNSDFVCPVCFDMIEEAHMTQCGHSFCHKCIKQSLERSSRCPKCNYVVERPDQIYPNFTLNELIMKSKGKEKEKKKDLPAVYAYVSGEIHDVFSDDLDLASVNCLLERLSQKKQKLEMDAEYGESILLKEFLQQVRQRKQQQMEKLEREVSILDSDLQAVEDRIKEQHSKLTACPDHLVPDGLDGGQATILDAACEDSFNSDNNAKASAAQSQPKATPLSRLAQRRRKMSEHFEDLEQCYLDMRTNALASHTSTHRMEDFTNCLSKFTRFSHFRPLASLSYAVDLFNGSSSIVSSIEFDRDTDFFAIAGVTKKIKVYEYQTVIQDAVDIHYPILEMVCQSKISSVSWSGYHKGGLASSDYEGTVTLWDANTGTRVKMFQEHEKRCWSVDYNHKDPLLLASGSDDCKVKLWSTNCEHSVGSLEAKANVCCVKFNPQSRFHIAFGSADHCVHYYDLRQPRQPLSVFRGHKKAVSYVKFLSDQELVSASTDSQLKMWSLSRPNSINTFTGHINEKNFVGLATDGDYILCGSENNSLYMYYKGLPKQLMTYKFDTVRSVLEKERKDDDSNEFVSAVTWKAGSRVVVAANSQGIVKILEVL